MFKLDTASFFIDRNFVLQLIFSNVSYNDLPIILYELTIVIKSFQEFCIFLK